MRLRIGSLEAPVVSLRLHPLFSEEEELVVFHQSLHLFDDRIIVAVVVVVA